MFANDGRNLRVALDGGHVIFADVAQGIEFLENPHAVPSDLGNLIERQLAEIDGLVVPAHAW